MWGCNQGDGFSSLYVLRSITQISPHSHRGPFEGVGLIIGKQFGGGVYSKGA